MGDLFLQIILWIYNNIAFQNLGLAVVEIAILTRIAFQPFLKQQSLQSKKMAEIQPHLNALKAKHKDNKQAMAAAQMELFKQYGVNPAAGCLPAIIQIVVMIGLYSGIGLITTRPGINIDFFGFNMVKPNIFFLPGIDFRLPGIFVVLAAATQFVQTKMMLPSAPAPQDKALIKAETKKEFMEEFAQAQGSMIWMFPLMFLFIGIQDSFPAALALYWSVSSTIQIFQQYRVAGLGGLEQYVVKLRSYGKNLKP